MVYFYDFKGYAFTICIIKLFHNEAYRGDQKHLALSIPRKLFTYNSSNYAQIAKQTALS